MKRMFKRLLKKKDKKRLILFGSGLLIAILIILGLASNLLLELHYMLGNDVIIDLSVNKEYFTLINGEMQTVEFTSSVKTNPFCETHCAYTFEDISFNTKIETDSFELKALTPVTKSFAIGAPTSGTGSKLYRFTMKCSNERTFFCKTSERPTERNMLITVDYDLSVSETQKKENAKQELISVQDAIQETYEKSQDLITTEQYLQQILITNYTNEITDLTNQLVTKYERITNNSWKKQQFDITRNEAISLQNSIKTKNVDLNIIRAKLSEEITRYNSLIEHVNSILWFDIRSYFTTTELVSNFSKDVALLEEKIEILQNRTSIETKERTLEPFFVNIESDFSAIKKFHNKTTIKLLNQTRELEILYCTLNNMDESLCLLSPDLITKESYCNRIEQLKNNFIELNGSWTKQVSTNEKTIVFPTICENENTNVSITIPSLKTYSVVNIDSPTMGFSLPKPESSCCIFDVCKPCCEDTTCSAEPIILLHGHTVNDKISPDINLDAFNAIQNKLETDAGIINAGRISLYDYTSLPQNIWGKFGVPFSIKASYYYDVYQHSNTNVIVKTNNEGIDTYAVRFREIVDKILFKMNAKKATIVAHSMGGLVTRRYLQIFGSESTEKVVLIATPNNGTFGIISSLCPLFGSNLECRDLASGSLFLNKLNAQSIPKIPFYTFIGTGCEMQGEEGDGVVLVRSAKLPGATEFTFTGTCDGTNTFHTEMIQDLETYPKVYEALESIIMK